MIYDGNVHEFVFWYFGGEVWAKAELERGLASVPGGVVWTQTHFNSRKLLTEEYRILDEVTQAAEDDVERKLIEREASILELKGMLITREQVLRERAGVERTAA